MHNAMTIDVEDYFQVSAFDPYLSRDDWDSMPCRVERNIAEILALLEASGARATFFMLGWLAERYPDMVRQIEAAGHEIASHGYWHWRVTQQTPHEFKQDVVRARKLLEDICGVAVYGYRAPSFSIGPTNLWGHEVLAEAGYFYSSSIYPIKHDHYGMPDAPRFAHQASGSKALIELPVTTVEFRGKNYPAGGGGYFRLLPYWLSRLKLQRVNGVDRKPCIFYFHPWEIDPGQPRQAGLNFKTRFRHYTNLGRMKSKLELLLRDFSWDRIDHVFPEVAKHSNAPQA
jgi:polysaccharide deacetylase family protein (PEP-CTERM system associated)